MSEVRHTPGPWSFKRMEGYEEQCRILGRPVEDHGGYLRHNDGAWVVMNTQPEPGPIASVTFRGVAKKGQAWNAPDPEGQANSRLIAAAPALLEALETMLKGDELGEFECQRQGFPRWIERQEKARAALALAKEGK